MLLAGIIAVSFLGRWCAVDAKVRKSCDNAVALTFISRSNLGGALILVRNGPARFLDRNAHPLLSPPAQSAFLCDGPHQLFRATMAD